MKTDFQAYTAAYKEFASIVELLDRENVFFGESPDELEAPQRAIWDKYAESYNYLVDKLDRFESIHRNEWFDVVNRELVTNCNHPRGEGFQQILCYI